MRAVAIGWLVLLAWAGHAMAAAAPPDDTPFVKELKSTFIWLSPETDDTWSRASFLTHLKRIQDQANANAARGITFRVLDADGQEEPLVASPAASALPVLGGHRCSLFEFAGWISELTGAECHIIDETREVVWQTKASDRQAAAALPGSGRTPDRAEEPGEQQESERAASLDAQTQPGEIPVAPANTDQGVAGAGRIKARFTGHGEDKTVDVTTVETGLWGLHWDGMDGGGEEEVRVFLHGTTVTIVEASGWGYQGVGYEKTTRVHVPVEKLPYTWAMDARTVTVFRVQQPIRGEAPGRTGPVRSANGGR